MLATLKACADQVSQPSWGLGGPHDAGSYCIWPHQTGFFHQHGSWNTPYGHFFMQVQYGMSRTDMVCMLDWVPLPGQQTSFGNFLKCYI
jgi:hypothetical protein